MTPLEEYSKGYFKLFADCIPVRGATTSAIYDLSRHRMVLFPSAYFDVILTLDGMAAASLCQEGLGDQNEARKIRHVIDYLIENEVAAVVANGEHFPSLATTFVRPSVIHNAIIDVDRTWHDFPKIFAELDGLGCQYVQIRVFSHAYDLEKLRNILVSAMDTTIRGFELLITYSAQCTPNILSRFVAENALVSHLTVHSAPMDSMIAVDREDDEQRGLATGRLVRYTRERITSDLSCGKIELGSINAPSMPVFTETKNHNGCLNGKISIDKDGLVKNCPSFCRAYGKFGSVTLASVVEDAGFRNAWDIKKDQISVCKDCQFRYACTDCRAHVQVSGDLFSKPSRCGYDPYNDVWNTSPTDGQLLHEGIRMDENG